MKRRLLAIMATLGILVALSAVPASPLATVPATLAQEQCDGNTTPKLSWRVVHRSNSETPFIDVSTTIRAQDIRACDAVVLDLSYSQIWLTVSNSANYLDGSSKLVQVGLQQDSLQAHPKFFYSKSDGTNTGDLTAWGNDPPYIEGHDYDVSISKWNGSYWRICIFDEDNGYAGTCKTIAKNWGANTFWFGCEMHDPGDDCGVSDSSQNIRIGPTTYVYQGNVGPYTVVASSCEAIGGNPYSGRSWYCDTAQSGTIIRPRTND